MNNNCTLTGGLNNADEFIKLLYQIYAKYEHPYDRFSKKEAWDYHESDSYDYSSNGINIRFKESLVYKNGRPEIIEELSGIFPSQLIDLAIMEENGLYDFKYKEIYTIPAFVVLHMNKIQAQDTRAEFFKYLFSVVSSVYGIGAIYKGFNAATTLAKVLYISWGAVNVVNNGSTLLSGKDGITNVKNYVIKQVENDNEKKRNAELLFDFVSLALNSVNMGVSITTGVTLGSSMGDIANAYSLLATFIPENDREVIKGIIESVIKELECQYIPY